jgi:hypothetical protein
MHDEYALSFTVAIETTKMAVRRNVWEDIKTREYVGMW